MADSLTLGTQPGALSVVAVIGDPWAASLILKTDGTPTAWTSAPVLEFSTATPLAITATLTADAATSTANAQANWTLTEGQVATLPGVSVRLSVDGITWWMGSVSCLS